jgi:AcrR family transcriptional regulator
MANPQRTRETAHGTATREKILQSAVELFGEFGYAGTSVNAVCSHAEVAKTALYWHFGNKEGLLTSVVEELTRLFVREIQSGVYREGARRDRLDMLIAGLRRVVVEQSHLMRVILSIVVEFETLQPEVRMALRDINGLAVEAISQGFEDATGVELPDMDLLAHHIIAYMEYAYRRHVLDPEDDIDRYFADLKNTILLMVRDRISRLNAKEKAQD